MPSPVSPIQIELTVDERVELEARARAQALPHRDVIRARVVLAVANGASFAQTARDFGQGAGSPPGNSPSRPPGLGSRAVRFGQVRTGAKLI